MSKYSVNQTVLRQEKYLVEALKEMGYEIEAHPGGAPLNSYYSDQEAKVANIIIRRDQLRGAYGDVGFVRQPDAQFAVIKDELDEYRVFRCRALFDPDLVVFRRGLRHPPHLSFRMRRTEVRPICNRRAISDLLVPAR